MAARRLFSKYDIFNITHNLKENVKKEVNNLDSNYFLNVSENELIDYLFDKLKMEVPIIKDDEIHAENSEVQVDISRDFSRDVINRSRPHFVLGTRTKIIIPFEGDAEYFDIQPSAWTTTYPYAEINKNEIILTYDQAQANAQQVKSAYERTLADIKKYLGWLSDNVNQFNEEIKPLIRQHISQRKEKLHASANMTEALGLPIKKKNDTPTTYSIPLTKREKPRVEMPTMTTSASQLEPILADEEYKYILSVLNYMAQVMEKSPKDFETMGEESLRTHFLVHLNGQYQGQATGETFNHRGKTDILLNVKGRNVFIAECKFWGGEKLFLETIDQILSYLSWRDTKTAILIFNRNKNFSDVLKTIRAVLPKHSCFKRTLDETDETTFKYSFHQPDDNNREMILSVMVFNVPTNK